MPLPFTRASGYTAHAIAWSANAKTFLQLNRGDTLHQDLPTISIKKGVKHGVYVRYVVIT